MTSVRNDTATTVCGQCGASHRGGGRGGLRRGHFVLAELCRSALACRSSG